MFKPFLCNVGIRSLPGNLFAPLLIRFDTEKVFFVILSAEPEPIFPLVVEDDGMVIPDVAIASIDSRPGYLPISRWNRPSVVKSVARRANHTRCFLIVISPGPGGSCTGQFRNSIVSDRNYEGLGLAVFYGHDDFSSVYNNSVKETLVRWISAFCLYRQEAVIVNNAYTKRLGDYKSLVVFVVELISLWILRIIEVINCVPVCVGAYRFSSGRGFAVSSSCIGNAWGYSLPG